ncbi:hypothetical protein SAMN04488116_3349 [Flagellimonas flava]|uniref:Uncharacterized protein n=1 Tax=Flagellimonas flava TaxID=570519 RepID=A0A1M5PU17_9FLAO|nr:hypothetical protein SAMN04488116_3349 [Allomuricauda flava]
MRPQSLFLLVFLLGFGVVANAQLNNYKYIIVPKKFKDYNVENKHQTSTNLKFLLVKNGFNVVYNDRLPEDLADNRCLGLLADLQDDSSMFTTKLTVVLRDCKGVEIFRSREGRSKTKEYKVSYREALMEAGTSFEGLNYEYTPKQERAEKETAAEKPIVVSFKNDVKSVEDTVKQSVVKQVATPEEQSFESKEPKTSSFKKAVTAEKAPEAIELLYAQPTETGYQLVDSSPKVILKLIKTSVDNIFLVDDEVKNGMVYKKGEKWYLEYAEGSGKKLEELHIKF